MKYCDERVCLCVRLSASISVEPVFNFTNFFMLPMNVFSCFLFISPFLLILRYLSALALIPIGCCTSTVYLLYI